jgi:uncharacterized protein with von Willebrand factor type A (vWA) domain
MVGWQQRELGTSEETRHNTEEETPGGDPRGNAGDQRKQQAAQQHRENEQTPETSLTGSSLEEKEEMLRSTMEQIKTKAIDRLTMEELTSLNKWNKYEAVKSAMDEVREYQVLQQRKLLDIVLIQKHQLKRRKTQEAVLHQSITQTSIFEDRFTQMKRELDLL